MPSRSAPAGLTPALLATLALTAAVGPFATDLYLAAFPEMTRELTADPAGVQATLTSFFLGLGSGQLFFGPLSDRLGRRGPLLAGLGFCLLASIGCALAPNLALLIAARFAQGFAGACGPVIARAVIADLASGRTAAGAFSLLMGVVGLAPVVAPLAGGLLLGLAGWRGLMWTIAAVTAAMLLSAAIAVPETHPPARRAELRTRRREHGSPWRRLRGRAFLGNLLVFAFGFGALMSHVSASPFVFQVMAGLDERAYGAVFASIALSMLCAAWLSARLARRVDPGRLLHLGLAGLAAGAALLLCLVLSGAGALWFWPAIALATFGVGLVMGNATARAIATVPGAGGAASACLGAAQFTVGAIVSPLVGAWGEHTALPLGLSMLGCAVLAAAGALLARGGPPAGR